MGVKYVVSLVLPCRSVTVRDSGITRMESPTFFPKRNGDGALASVQTDSTVEEASDQPLKRMAFPWRVLTSVVSMIVASMGFVVFFMVLFVFRLGKVKIYLKDYNKKGEIYFKAV